MGNSDHVHGKNGAAANGHAEHVAWAPTRVEPEPEVDTRLDLAAIWNILKDGRRTIALISLSFFALVMLVTLASRMDFTVKASVYLGDLQNGGGMLDVLSSQFDLGEKGDIGTEVEILRSRELITKAVLASGLNTRLTPRGWSPPRYWRWRLGGRDLQTLEGAWSQLRAVSTKLTAISDSEREVEIKFSDATHYEVRKNGDVLGTGTLGEALVLPQLEMTLMPGIKGAPKPGSEYYLEVLPMEERLEEIGEKFTAKSPKASLGTQVNIVQLEFTWSSPYAARMFLQELMRLYLEQNLAWKTEEAGAAEAFLSKQLENIRDSLDKAGKDLADFKKSSTTIALSEEAKSMIEQMGTLEQQRVAARLEVESLQQVKNALAKGNVPTEAYLVGEAQDTVLMAMSQNLVKMQQEYKSLSEQFTPDYPPVRDAHAALTSQLQAVRSYVNNRLKRAQDQAASLDNAIERYTGRLKELPDAELKLATLTQETEVYSKLYQFLLERQQQAALTKASTISKSRVLDPPVLPSREATPRLRVRVALGLLLGLMFSIGFVLVRRQLATSFQSETEVRKALPAMALFASIPRKPDEKKRPGLGGPARPLEALASDLRSPFAESFRLLRTNLYYSGSRDRDKIVLISSPGPGDGKTMSTLCLAGILAADGKRVLVVDGDMRKPSHHMLLRQQQHPGLSGILTSEMHWRTTVHSVQTPFGEFSSISTGIVPPNPAELLSSSALATFLAEAKEEFDFILIDSPPFPLVSDALILSQYADRHLSVIRIGNTHRRIADEHIRRIAAATPRYGIVINGVAGARGYGYGYGYGYGVRDPAQDSRPQA